MKLPKFSSKAFLSPMAGISDAAFRLLASECGAGLTVTELTNVHAILHKHANVKGFMLKNFIQYSDEESPRSIQLFGNNIDLIVKAAKIVEPYFDLVDFNMGCPSPHITNQMAGAALLEKPVHVKELFSRLVDAVDKPVTLKIRAGIDNNNETLFLPIAKIAEECGVSMIALHARTLKDNFSGHSRWELIKELKQSVNIPVVGNGDIMKPEDAKKMLEETGCDYVMIGRAAMGNPYLFTQVDDYLKTGNYENQSMDAKLKYFYTYLGYTKKFSISFSNIKEQSMWFTKGLVNGAVIRSRISGAKDIDGLLSIFQSSQS